jgi:DNA-directed RNA polymerase I, II, and III subunit RPABC2
MATTNQVTDDYKKFKNADVSAYITLPWMTKYEFDQLIGLRTMHLSKGAAPFVDLAEGFTVKGNMELRKVALQEIQEKKLPYIIKRPLPNGSAEYWPVSKLSLEAVKYMMR